MSSSFISTKDYKYQHTLAPQKDSKVDARVPRHRGLDKKKVYPYIPRDERIWVTFGLKILFEQRLRRTHEQKCRWSICTLPYGHHSFTNHADPDEGDFIRSVYGFWNDRQGRK